MEIFESLIPVGIVLLCIAGVVALGAMAYLFDHPYEIHEGNV